MYGSVHRQCRQVATVEWLHLVSTDHVAQRELMHNLFVWFLGDVTILNWAKIRNRRQMMKVPSLEKVARCKVPVCACRIMTQLQYTVYAITEVKAKEKY